MSVPAGQVPPSEADGRPIYGKYGRLALTIALALLAAGILLLLLFFVTVQ